MDQRRITTLLLLITVRATKTTSKFYGGVQIMIQGYAIYLRTHRETGKQYGGCVWWSDSAQTAEKACARRWKREDREGIAGLFGGFDSRIVLIEKREDTSKCSDGLYRIRIAVDEQKTIDTILPERRLNVADPLKGMGLIPDTCVVGGQRGAKTCKHRGIGIFGMSLDQRRQAQRNQPREIQRATGLAHYKAKTAIFAPGTAAKGARNQSKESKAAGGRIGGGIARASGQIYALGDLYGKISVVNGQLAAARASRTKEQMRADGKKGVIMRFIRKYAGGR
jgi:hypothetical protein